MSYTSGVNHVDARMPVLDGIRAVSIIAVLITHLFPFRIAGERYNTSLGMFGMSLFFILSGFLVTRLALKKPTANSFVTRRLSRIVPAAWLCIGLVVIFGPNMDPNIVLGYLAFYANLPPQTLQPPLDHFWSLCVEVQFYLLIYVLLLIKADKLWLLIPLLLVTSTANRMFLHVDGTSFTWFRIDEILAGSTLALFINKSPGILESKNNKFLNVALIISTSLLWLSSIHEVRINENWLSYFRAYFAAATVGILLAGGGAGLVRRWLESSWMRYIASISYALYIWHLPLAATWLGSGGLSEKYMKRPILLVVIFGVAHLSTYYFENKLHPVNRKANKNS